MTVAAHDDFPTDGRASAPPRPRRSRAKPAAPAGPAEVTQATSHPAAIQLMTAGYEGNDQEAFVNRLLAAGVKRVIDTRYTPASRKRGLSKGPLSARLAEVGIDYVHLREVGTPKPWRDEYKRDHDFGKLAARYRPYLEERVPVLRQIFELAREKPSVLICFEAEAHRCHRSLVAARVAEVFGREAAIEVVDL